MKLKGKVVDKKVLDFVLKHRISVLTTLLKDGSPHSSSMHYASSEKPLEFVFLTEKGSRKLNNLGASFSPASLVIGFSEEEWVELQMEGEVKILKDKKELSSAWDLYAGKFKGADKYKDDPVSMVLLFRAKWWRYTEFRPKPTKIISSEK